MTQQEEIRALCRERRAVILAHYYTPGAVQDVADFVGDSLALARQAANTDADVIVMCGVHFMAETCKLLSPDKTVLEPAPAAGCSLADSLTADELRQWKHDNPGALVVQYVNTTAAVKAETDIVVTSGNAVRIVNQLPSDRPILFGPDRNLGRYLNAAAGRQMTLWHGACHVHDRFDAAAIDTLRRQHPEATVLAHLECQADVLDRADVKGSTADMLRYVGDNPPATYIVATEAGILHELRKRSPESVFLPLPYNQAPCNECEHMKLNTLDALLACLRAGAPEVTIPEALARQAVKPIQRMLEMS